MNMKHETTGNHEIVALEKKYWQAMQDNDLDAALSLTDFPCLVAGSHGVQSVEREQFIEMFNQHKDSVKEFSFLEEPSIRLLTPTTAVIAYKMRVLMNMNGQEKNMEVVDTSTWIKRDVRWVCAMHAEAEVSKEASSQAA
jgi:hypothetical protein